GDRFDLSSMPFRVTDVPGHTPSCILIHDKDNLMAFTGDFLVRDIASSPLIQRANVVPEGYKSLKSYITSLRKMRDMNFRVALPGHGEIVENPSTRINDLLAFIDEKRQRVLGILKKGAQTPVEISHELFPDLPPDQLFSGVCDVLGHLQILEEEGLALRRGVGPVYFSAT
ncbi:MAG: MBL fold metallo-hydrolase, partial [Pseudomonadota bacterium]